MTKSALGIDPAEYGVTDPLHAWRIRKARNEAERRELVFLRNNLTRRFFIRKTIPFEADGWIGNEHKASRVVLVRWMIDAEMMHRLYMRGDPTAFLDTEDFCRDLYFRICPDSEDGVGNTSLSREAHATLLEAHGVKVNREKESVDG